MTQNLTNVEWRAVLDAIGDACANATEKQETVLFSALRKLEDDRKGRTLTSDDSSIVRKVIARAKDAGRIYHLDGPVLDEIGDAIIEGRPVRKLPTKRKAA
ncbi:hypothetical protein [Leifsonia sp. Leaf264]|uniref:hypothetical protein n=1 Tax=Leifsonia sp. Leaf264 TaxID=1736314 RepID=UPI0006F20E2B|nr:hypothetical protein [Leifsonia sp. Leaf264]KQO98411.1 hypothetical protein ASF30_10140 [Leifsonia sp. Leaf264]